MAEPKITGAMRIVDGSTNLRTLKELNTLLTTLNTNVTNLSNKLDTLMNYSTSEQAVGKWIDGKTIYRKVLTGTKAASSNEISLSTPSNIDTMIDYIVRARHNSNSEWQQIPNIVISYSNGNTYRGLTYLNNNASWNNNHLYIVGVTDLVYFHAIIYYTKK